MKASNKNLISAIIKFDQNFGETVQSVRRGNVHSNDGSTELYDLRASRLSEKTYCFDLSNDDASVNLTDVLQVLKDANVPFDVIVSDDVYSAARPKTKKHIQVIETVSGETVVDIWDGKIEEIGLNATKSNISILYLWASMQVDIVDDVSFRKSTLGLGNLDNIRRANKMAESLDDKAFEKLDRGFFEMVAKYNGIDIKDENLDDKSKGFLYITAKEIRDSILTSDDRKKIVSSLKDKGVEFRFDKK